MYHVTLDYAKKHFEEIIERAKSEPDGVLIVQDNQSFLLIDKSELESWTETAELLEDPNIVSDIQEARAEYRKGETLTMEQVFEQ
ncbi:type II toxin-antitoxin system Phd/YefM family antitoxin [Aphanothece sacrum]|uniref:Antitoxin n=1 Tax=Aphanothece sacrum FPU1 TaxID=1920663 RepID=A0A401IFB6_APHSA|nr:type II toxin-antitoxin system prevent-host-death family antitoxin [Aphanothece sacrum]GBF79973.1 prevent-host-death family protein [Aphanothece sacrum FPU1]GBF83807.1 prevent-host-death family protein [Aphanothece sacrum FPU3]